ncbi:MAG: hypothetical protein WAV89_06865 [Ignavibacteriaceae bacterium]
MTGDIVNNRRLIKDVDAVQRFRDILFYQIRISISAIFLYYPITVLLTMLTIDPFKLLLWLIAAAAILFTPYIFYVLIKERKFGWIITFFVMIIIPLLFVHYLFLDALFHDAIILIPLAFFYFYCFLIKYDVDRWLSDYYSHQEFLQQEKERAERMRQNLFLE